MWSIEQDQEPEEASEQITIVPDIVDMSDNYENIKVTRKGKGVMGHSTVIFFKVMKC